MIFLGVLIVSTGVIILKHTHVVTGGTAGLSLNLAYLFGLPFSVLFFIVNIPFYIFSVVQMGWKFTLYTIASVSLLSGLTSIDQWLPAFSVPVWVGVSAGGVIIGLGLSILFANGSSLGGANILALFLHKKYKFNPGVTTFIFDFIVVATSLYAVGLLRGVSSVFSIAITSIVISYFKNYIATKQEKPVRSKNVAVKKHTVEA